MISKSFKSNPLFLFFILILLVLSCIPFSVSALGEQTDYTEDFEDDTLTQQSTDAYYGATWCVSDTAGANSYVDNTHSVSGAKSYRSYRDEISNFTLTYSSTSYLETFSVLFYTGHSTGWSKFWTFYNETGTTIFNFKTDNGGVSWNTFHWEDFNGWNEEDDVLVFDVWYWLNITVTGNDTYNFEVVRYSTGVALVEKTGEAPVTIVDTLYPRVVLFEYDGNNAGFSEATCWFDDLTIEFEFAEAPDEEGTLPPCSPYNTLGEVGGTSLAWGLTYEYIHIKYNSETSGYIHRVDLEIHQDLPDNYGLTINDFYCKINEFSLGTATELIQLGEGENYRASWTGLNLHINGTMISVTFRQPTDYAGGQHWLLPVTTNDIFEDGYIWFVGHNQNHYWNNHGEYIDVIPTGEDVSLYQNYEFPIRLCYEIDSGFEFNPDIVNDVESFASSSNAFCSQINIDWFLNSTAMAYINVLWIDTPSLAPYIARNITTQTGHIYFTPTETGTFYFNLSSNGANVSTDSETISGTCSGNWVYIVPNPSGDTPFMIFYNYTGASNGAIRVYDSSNNLLETLYIVAGEGSFSYQLNTHGVYYFRLCSIANVGGNTVYNQLYSYVHCVQGYVVNYIEIPFADDYDFAIENAPVLISGEHSHLSKDVWIYIGASKFKPVSTQEHFSIQWKPDKQGDFIISLRILLPSGRIVTLASTSVKVVGKDAILEPRVLPKLDVAVGYILGAIVVLIFIFAPMIVASKLGYTKQQIPTLVYYLSAGVGVVLNTALELWDFWAIFFILAFGVIVVLVLFLIGKYKQGGG